MTVNVLCLWVGIGWRQSRQPIPTHYKDIVMICHSERSEESNIFYRTTMISDIKIQKVTPKELNMNNPGEACATGGGDE